MTTVGQILKAIDCACKLICFPCRVVSIACIYVCKLLKAVVKYTWRAVRKVLKYVLVAAAALGERARRVDNAAASRA